MTSKTQAVLQEMNLNSSHKSLFNPFVLIVGPNLSYDKSEVVNLSHVKANKFVTALNLKFQIQNLYYHRS